MLINKMRIIKMNEALNDFKHDKLTPREQACFDAGAEKSKLVLLEILGAIRINGKPVKETTHGS